MDNYTLSASEHITRVNLFTFSLDVHRPVPLYISLSSQNLRQVVFKMDFHLNACSVDIGTFVVTLICITPQCCSM